MSKLDFEGFAKAIIESPWYETNFDGGDIQALGVEFGLLKEVETNGVCPGMVGYDCTCLEVVGEIPDTCFRIQYNED